MNYRIEPQREIRDKFSSTVQFSKAIDRSLQRHSNIYVRPRPGIPARLRAVNYHSHQPVSVKRFQVAAKFLNDFGESLVHTGSAQASPGILTSH